MRTTTTAPCFPSYLFVCLSLGLALWLNVKGIIGARRLSGFADHPAPGVQVRCVGGSFDKLQSAFLKATDSERVSNLMTMLARKVTVNLPKAAVTAA